MNFSDKVRNLLTPDGNRMNLTPEQREILTKVQNAGNAEIYEDLPTSVAAVTIAKAVEMSATATEQTNADIFASSIDLATTKEHFIIPCATSKATNIVTGDLKDAVVIKAINTLQVHQVEGSTANAMIRNDELMPFAAKSTEIIDDIVKKSSIRDFNMSGTLFPGDVRQAPELNQFMTFQHKYKAVMLAKFLMSAARVGLSEDQLLTIYRSASRSLAEDIFESTWKERHPIYNNADSEQVDMYQNARRAYMDTLETIGSKYMSSSSVRFGMSLRKVSISPEMKWSSENKIGHIKKFGINKSYYVGTNIDSGIQTVPVTTKMLTEHIDDIIIIVRAGCALTEKEVRLENGLPADTIVIPEYTRILYDEALLGSPYYSLLGISETQEAAIYDRLTAELRQKAILVIEAVDTKSYQSTAEDMRNMLG